MGNVFLIGFMGSGKTTVGRKLSKKTGRRLFDTDEKIVEMAGKPISEIFKDEGEEHFRMLETRVLEGLSGKEDYIISCGGGMALREKNVELMKKKGQVVYLSAGPETILERVKRSNRRPILEGNKNIEFIRDLMEKRVDFYEKAADIRILVDEKTVEGVCDEILKGLKM